MTRFRAASTRSDLQSPTIACFVAQYAVQPEAGVSPALAISHLVGDKFGRSLRCSRPGPYAANVEADAAVAKNKPIIVWPIGGKLFWWIDRLSPSLCIKMARDIYDSNQRLTGLE